MADYSRCQVATAAATACTTSTSCCASYTITSTGTAAGTDKICWPTGTMKLGVSSTLTAATVSDQPSANTVWALAACPASSGASTVAASVAAAATALYAMY